MSYQLKYKLYLEKYLNLQIQLGGTNKKVFEHAIFFDNSEINISGTNGVCVICKNMKCVKVNETSPKPLIPWNDSPLKEYLVSIGPNTYVDIIKTLWDEAAYDAISGINKREISIFSKWKKETKSFKNRAAIFDWDRTITLMEGMISLNNANTITELRSILAVNNPKVINLSDIIIEDMLIYLLGGVNRLKRMRKLFKKCFTSNIQIIILTNSSSCEMKAFDDLLHGLFLDIPYIKICSSVRTAEIQGKGDYLRMNPSFEICI